MAASDALVPDSVASRMSFATKRTVYRFARLAAFGIATLICVAWSQRELLNEWAAEQTMNTISADGLIAADLGNERTRSEAAVLVPRLIREPELANYLYDRVPPRKSWLCFTLMEAASQLSLLSHEPSFRYLQRCAADMGIEGEADRLLKLTSARLINKNADVRSTFALRLSYSWYEFGLNTYSPRKVIESIQSRSRRINLGRALRSIILLPDERTTPSEIGRDSVLYTRCLVNMVAGWDAWYAVRYAQDVTQGVPSETSTVAADQDSLVAAIHRYRLHNELLPGCPVGPAAREDDAIWRAVVQATIPLPEIESISPMSKLDNSAMGL